MASELKRYTVVLPHGQETVMKLNETDAKRYGAVPLGEPVPAEAEPTAAKPRRRRPAAGDTA